MSVTTFHIKQNDTKPSLSVQLLSDGSAVDLTGAMVKFHMGTIIDAAATIVNAATGNVKYNWAVGDTATAGKFNAEFEVTFSDGTVETFPNDGYLLINIMEELA